MTPNTGQLLQSFELPAGNGLPPLDISAIDPLSWVAAQAAMRQEGAQLTDPNADSKIEELRKQGRDLLNGVNPLGAIKTAVSDYAKSLAILAVLLLLGAGLVLLGAWQFTRE